MPLDIPYMCVWQCAVLKRDVERRLYIPQRLLAEPLHTMTDTVPMGLDFFTSSDYKCPLAKPDVTWRSVYADIASVDSDGLVTLLRPGYAEIEVECKPCQAIPSEVSEEYVATWHIGFTVLARDH